MLFPSLPFHYTLYYNHYCMYISSPMGEEAKESNGGDGVVKEENKQKEKSENNEDNNNNNSDDEIIVIKVDMHCHCEACAKKIVRALRASQGVEEVAVDRHTNMVEVKGKTVEPPLKLCERIHHKTGRQAHLLSPLPKPPQVVQPTDDNHLPHKKPEAVRRVIVLRVHMHCEACAHHLRKRIRKLQGVEAVETDVSKDEVRVKGVIADDDPEILMDYVHKRTRKQVSLVNILQIEPQRDQQQQQQSAEPAKQQEDQEKGNNNNNNNNNNIVKNNTTIISAGLNFPNNNKNHLNNIDEHDNNMMMMGDMNMHVASYNPPFHHYPAAINYQQPPIFFSDEDPNACSIM